jgi:hypothetical protein
MKRLFSIILLLLMMGAPMRNMAQALTASQSEIWEISTQLFNSWQNSEFDAFSGMIHPEYQGWSNHDSLPLSKETMLNRFKKGAEKYHLEIVKRQPVYVTVTGTAAVVDYLFTYNMITKGDEKQPPVVLTGKNAEFFVKEEDRWMLLGDMTEYQRQESDR